MKIMPFTGTRPNTVAVPAFRGLPTYEPDVYIKPANRPVKLYDANDVFINRKGQEVIYYDPYDEWLERYLLDYWA